MTRGSNPLSLRLPALVAAAVALLATLAVTASQASAASLVPPAGTCVERGIAAPVPAQREEMLCLVNYARQQVGEAPLEEALPLQESAAEKARDIIRCDSFSHFACGRAFTYWMRASGYLEGCWHAGENLAYGVGRLGSALSIFRAWLRSPTHRANLLGDYAQTGLSLRVGRLEGSRGVRVWAQHFGSHC